MQSSSDLGLKLRQAREEAGLSAAKAGELLHVHENTVYALEKDPEARQVQLVRRAADVYGITMAQLFGEAEPRLPVEFRPLLEPLLALTMDQRVTIIRNIASNLGLMASLYAASAPRLETYSHDAKHNASMTDDVSSDNLTEQNHLAATLMTGVPEDKNDPSIGRREATQRNERNRNDTSAHRRAP